MSRKRDKRREQKAELARQLGVKVGDLDESSAALRAQERVCSPALKASLAVTKAGLGLLRRPGPLALHLALYLVDKRGARLVRQQLWTGKATKVPGPASLAATDLGGDDERVRYARPAHFVLLALVTEGAEEARVHAHAIALGEAKRLSLVVDTDEGSERRALADGAFAAARFEVPRHAVVLVDDTPLAAPRLAAVVVSLPGVHRTREQLALELASPDERLRATASVDLRL